MIYVLGEKEMKKFLIAGGVLFSILPAMALQLTDVIEPNDNGDCSGENFQSNSVSMQAVYVTETCPAGYYFDVPANAAIDSTTGIVTGASCQPCTDGYYCPSTVTVAANNGVLSTQGRTQCPAGTYGNATNRGTIPSDTNDPDYNTILANYTACQACSGTTYASNTGSTSCTSVTQGWYADKVNSNDPGNTTQTQCPFGYDAIVADSEGACTKTVSCSSVCSNFNNVITADDNPNDQTKICSASVNSNNNNIVNGNVTFGNRSTNALCTVSKTCKDGYTAQNMYTWMAQHPEALSGNVSYCSPNGTGAGCTTQERGTVTIPLTNAPMDAAHYVAICSDKADDYFSSNVVDYATAEAAGFSISGTGSHCWMHSIDLPDQPWIYLNYTHGSNVASSPENCAQYCGNVPGVSQDYLLGTMQNGSFTLLAQEFVDAFDSAADLTDGQNGHPTADVCVANTITINWGDIADPGDAGTCTYGEDFTAPQSGPNPADHPGLKFLGWKVIPTNNNNNN